MRKITAFVFGAGLLGGMPAAHATLVCSDMDGDGVAETCIEVDDGQASFPGQDPPEVPEVPDPVPEE